MTVGGLTLTYIRVKGKWVYLYRAVDSSGATIDFLLSAKRDAAAAKRFQSQSLGAVRIIRRRGSSTPTSTPVIRRRCATQRRRCFGGELPASTGAVPQ